VFLGRGSPPGFVTLTEGLSYRVEIEPDQAAVSLRVRRQPRTPPLFMTPLAGATSVSGARAFLVVPRASEEYRVDVVTYGDAPVRVRIIYDPQESARWLRVAESSRGRPPAGLALRAAYLGTFPAPPPAGSDSFPDASAYGVEACLGVLPRGSWFSGPVGGCALLIGRYWRGERGGVFFVGVAPRVLLTRADAPVETSLAAQFAIGTSVLGQSDLEYRRAGAGLHSAILIGSALAVEAEAGLSIVLASGARGFVSREDQAIIPHFALGLQYRFRGPRQDQR
jgi:hypothetical protein